MLKYGAIIGMLLVGCGSALAEEVKALNVDESTLLLPQGESYLLASNDAASMKMQTAAANEKSEYKVRWLTRNKFHEYLGIGSLALAGVAVIVPKEQGNDSIHHQLAVSAAALGAGAVATGLLFHWKDLDLKKGFHDPDNVHALLAGLGAIGFLVAVSQAPSDVHAAAGVGGLASMALGIKVEW